MSKLTSVDAPRSSSIEASRLQGEMRTDVRKNIPTNKSIYLAKKHVELKFEKIKRAFSSLVYGKEFSRNAHAQKILNIKQKISAAKSSYNTSKNHDSSATDSLDRAVENKIQRSDVRQDKKTLADANNNPRATEDSRRRMPDVPP